MRGAARAAAATSVAAGLVLVLWASPSLGHSNHGPTLGERYAKLDLGTDRSRLVYGLTYTDRHGLEVRQEADRDDDGRIDDEERAAHAALFVKTITEGARVLVDGEPAPLEWGQPYLAPAEDVSPGPLAVEIVATFTVPPGEHRVTLDDRAEFIGIYRTSLEVATRPRVEVSRAGRGAEPAEGEVDRRLVFLDLPAPGPPPARVATVVVTMPGEVVGAGGEASPPWWPLAAAGGLVLLIVTLVVVARRRRKDGGGSGRGSGRGSRAARD